MKIGRVLRQSEFLREINLHSVNNYDNYRTYIMANVTIFNVFTHKKPPCDEKSIVIVLLVRPVKNESAGLEDFILNGI